MKNPACLLIAFCLVLLALAGIATCVPRPSAANAASVVDAARERVAPDAQALPAPICALDGGSDGAADELADAGVARVQDAHAGRCPAACSRPIVVVVTGAPCC